MKFVPRLFRALRAARHAFKVSWMAGAFEPVVWHPSIRLPDLNARLTALEDQMTCLLKKAA